jgi:hypothetical protein
LVATSRFGRVLAGEADGVLKGSLSGICAAGRLADVLRCDRAGVSASEPALSTGVSPVCGVGGERAGS